MSSKLQFVNVQHLIGRCAVVVKRIAASIEQALSCSVEVFYR